MHTMEMPKTNENKQLSDADILFKVSFIHHSYGLVTNPGISFTNRPCVGFHM